MLAPLVVKPMQEKCAFYGQIVKTIPCASEQFRMFARCFTMYGVSSLYKAKDKYTVNRTN
jgi:hypothetical protein